MRPILIVLSLLTVFGCVPKEQVVFKQAKNIRLEAGNKDPMLKADMVFFNPNKTKMKLKKMSFDVLVNDKKAGYVDQTLNQMIAGDSDFTIPLEVQLDLKELGLLDTIVSLFGGKKYEVRVVGKIRGSVHGVTMNIPVDHKEEIKIRL